MTYLEAGSWNLLAELDDNNVVVRSYMWGKDISGTLNGAGGVGGLLGVDDVSQGFHFVAYDGNGNVMALVDADDGTVSTEYEYGPFGELIRATGPMSDNPIRFSTKYYDTETGLVYYGYRYYWPAIGRWLNRDPIGERGGLNLYGFVNNKTISSYDYLGLFTGAPDMTPGYPSNDNSVEYDDCEQVGKPKLLEEWGIQRYELIDLERNGSIGMFADHQGNYDGIDILWGADAAVECECKCLGNVKARGRYGFIYTIEKDIWIYDINKGAISIPTPKSFPEAIGEVAAEVVKSQFSSFSLDLKTLAMIKEYIADHDISPKTADDGNWWIGDNPCDKVVIK